MYIVVSGVQDPLVHRGRHFGRTVHAFANLQNLILNRLEMETKLKADPQTKLAIV